MQQIIGSNALIFNKDGKFLLVKRSDNDDYFAGFWELPGGGVDGKETPQESLNREILEECGLEVIVGQPTGVHIFYLDNETVKVTEITFLCKLTGPDKKVQLSFEHSDFKWVRKEEVNALQLSDYMKGVVEDVLANPIVKGLTE